MKNLNEKSMTLQYKNLKNCFKISKKRHLVITGSKGSGKSTLFNKIRDENSIGFLTYPIRDMQLRPKKIIFQSLITNNIFTFALPSKHRMEICKDVVSDGIVPEINEIMSNTEKTVFIDEIGYLENENSVLYEKILNIFNNKNVVCVLKKEETELYKKIISREDIFIYDLDEACDNSKIGCVVMASGNSKRFAYGNKLLHMFCDKPLIAHTLDNIPKDRFSRIVVVTRYEQICDIANKIGLNSILHSEEYLSDTIKIGLNSMKDMDYCMFCVADQPFCSQESYINLINKAIQQKVNIVRLCFQDTVGSPVIFPKAFYDELLELNGEVGGNFVVKKHIDKVDYVSSKDIFELWDIDNISDIEKCNIICQNIQK